MDKKYNTFLIEIIALVKIIAQCNKNYHLEGDFLRRENKNRLFAILNSKGKIENEFDCHGVLASKDNVTLAKKSRKLWKDVDGNTKKSFSHYINSLCLCYQI